MVEEAWALSDRVRAYIKESGRDVELDEVWEKIFSHSPMIDLAATLQGGELPPSKIVLKSPYGLYYKPATRDWLPFRHGTVSTSEPS